MESVRSALLWLLVRCEQVEVANDDDVALPPGSAVGMTLVIPKTLICSAFPDGERRI
jgi:hypothetical protein